jgi:hypothetical protein
MDSETDFRVEVERLDEHSDLITDRRILYLRVPVSNRKGRKAATEVEVFLESIQEQAAGRRVQLPTYLPLRLLWCHGDSAVCDRIAGGAYRLLDLGSLVSQTGRYNPNTDETDETDVTELELRTEIWSRFRVSLPLGSYTIQLLITSAIGVGNADRSFRRDYLTP